MPRILHEAPEDAPEIGAPIVAHIYRFDPSSDSSPYLQEYTVPYRRRMSVLTLLHEIYENQDPTLAFRSQLCGRGICRTCICRMGSEKKAIKACNTTLQPGEHVTIWAYNDGKVIRDLVVDL